jgi:hemerythrin superfamily protein
MDAITLLKDDHRTVAQLFTRFEQAGDEAYEAKRQIVERIIHELSIHAAIEELAFYPAVRREVKGAQDMALESLEEHHIVKWQLSELEGMDPHAERFDAKVTVLIENVRHHVEEEEGEMFPKVRDQMSRATLDELGDRLAAAKKTVPSRPHPRTPDTPPANLIAGAAAGLVDKATDVVKSAVSDTISMVTRSGDEVAEQVTDSASSVKDTAEKTVRKAKSTTTRSTRKATAKAKPAAKKARSSSPANRSTKRAATTAKRTAKKAPATAKKSATATKRTTRKATASAKKAPTSANRAAKRTTKKATSSR